MGSSQRTRRLMQTLTLTPEGVTSSITDSSNNGAGSITTGGWWCELEREKNQCETGVSYPTRSNLVNSNRTPSFTQKLTNTNTINCQQIPFGNKRNLSKFQMVHIKCSRQTHFLIFLFISDLLSFCLSLIKPNHLIFIMSSLILSGPTLHKSQTK